MLTLLILFSCTNTKKELTVEDEKVEITEKPKNESFEERMTREIISSLNIPSSEKYTLEIHKVFLNDDPIEDAIITVNRLEFARSEAAKSGSTAKMAEIGFMGPYNYFFYFDGSLDKLSVPIPVQSTPGRKLEASFVNLLSDKRKDVVLEYRVRNSGYKAYYSVINGTNLSLVFQWKWFDFAGESKPEALFHKLVPNKEKGGNDIEIYESVLENNSEVKDIYEFTPKISKQTKKIHHFFYAPQLGKFAEKRK